MTIKESLKSRKVTLVKEAKGYKEKLSGEINDTLSKLERGLVTALIVGGSTFIAYKFFKRILENEEILEPDGDTDTEEDIPENQLDLPFENQKGETKSTQRGSPGSPSSELLKGAGEVIMLMLLAFAKSKLTDHLANFEKENEEKDL